MSHPGNVLPPVFPTAVESERVRLALLARGAALSVPGVVSADAGPTGLFTTAGGDEPVEGVMCVAAPEGGYDVSLRLACLLVPLPALGQRVQSAVEAVGRRAGISVASVSVYIAEVIDLGGER